MFTYLFKSKDESYTFKLSQLLNNCLKTNENYLAHTYMFIYWPNVSL